jgi:hypothetical protein
MQRLALAAGKWPGLGDSTPARACSWCVMAVSATAPSPAPRPVPTYDQDAITWKNGNGFARNQQLGKAMLQSGELLRQLKEYGADKGMPSGALEQWATAHPGLAYKRLQELKRQVALRVNR